jgi:hypothetical protein
MSWLDKAREALAMASQARTTLASVADAVKDGRTGLATTDQAELNRLLAEEAKESRAAHDSLDAAIREAEARQ